MQMIGSARGYQRRRIGLRGSAGADDWVGTKLLSWVVESAFASVNSGWTNNCIFGLLLERFHGRPGLAIVSVSVKNEYRCQL